MKIDFSTLGYIRIDLSDESSEVCNFLLDQIQDRAVDEFGDEIEIDANYDHKFLEVSIPILDLIYRIIEEKNDDIRYETSRIHTLR